MAAEGAARRGWWQAAAHALGDLLEARRCFARAGWQSRRAEWQCAHDLLVRCLSPVQRADYRRGWAFQVLAPSGRRYRITYGTAANIDVLGADGAILHHLCARPEDSSPPAVMLVQKLMLESAEDEFLRIAVRHPPRPASDGGWLGIAFG